MPPDRSTEGAGRAGRSDDELLAECRVDTFRAGGKGGQHQNVTESGVRLTHLPTGIVVTAREERSQYRNRKVALQRLRAKLRELNRRRRRRIPTEIPRHEREERLKEKRARSRMKDLRRRPDRDE